MPLPKTITTKISSEAAGYVSLVPVERRVMALSDLLERILALTGKRAGRIREILLRGTLVHGQARYRWESIEATEEEVQQALDRFPDPEPSRPFEASKCHHLVLRGKRGTLDLPQEVASEKRLFKRKSFWDVLLPTVEAHSPAYQRYSYSQRADVYVAALSHEAVQELAAQARLLKYSTLIQQLLYLELESAEVFVER